MCHEVGPGGEGAISDICGCSCEGNKMIDISREEAVGGRPDRRTRLGVLRNAGQYPSCGDWIDLGRKSRYGCGLFWAYECRWCVEKKHFNLKCHQQKSPRRDAEFKGNGFYSRDGRVYYSDFVDCFKNHGHGFLNTLRGTQGECFEWECATPLDVDLEFMEKINYQRKHGSSNCGGKVYKPNPVPLKFDCGLWEIAHDHSKRISWKDMISFSDSDGSSTGGFIDLRATGGTVRAFADPSLSSAQGTFWHFMGANCDEVMNPDAGSIGVARVHNPHKKSKYYWTLVLGHKSQESDSSCLQSAEAGEGLTLTSSAESAMITSEDFAIYGFALVGLISVLFFLRSAFRSHFSEYKTIDETTTLEEVSA